MKEPAEMSTVELLRDLADDAARSADEHSDFYGYRTRLKERAAALRERADRLEAEIARAVGLATTDGNEFAAVALAAMARINAPAATPKETR